MSSFTHMNGPFDYNATPTAPTGIKTLIYETPQQRKTWAQHGVDAWYIGYCPDHYRCHKTYVPATRGERISRTVSFFSHDFSVRSNNHHELSERCHPDNCLMGLQNHAEKGNSMGNSFSLGCWDICLVAAVVVWSVPDIPGINTLLRPSFALLWCFVD